MDIASSFFLLSVWIIFEKTKKALKRNMLVISSGWTSPSGSSNTTNKTNRKTIPTKVSFKFQVALDFSAKCSSFLWIRGVNPIKTFLLLKCSQNLTAHGIQRRTSIVMILCCRTATSWQILLHWQLSLLPSWWPSQAERSTSLSSDNRLTRLSYLTELCFNYRLGQDNGCKCAKICEWYLFIWSTL